MTDQQLVIKVAKRILEPTLAQMNPAAIDKLSWGDSVYHDHAWTPMGRRMNATTTIASTWALIFPMICIGDLNFGPRQRSIFEMQFKAEIAYVPPVDRSAQCTTDGKPFDPTEGDNGQQKNYVVLCAEERAKGFVRPVRRSYIHVGVGGHEIDPSNPAKHGRTGKGCGVETTMGPALCETYARDPKFYSHTFCAGCKDHFPVAEFVWAKDGERVGS